MNPALEKIPGRILDLAIGALTQANHHAVFSDPGNEHWDFISVINAAHAGELFLKAIIAKEHPLLIFKDLFNLDDNQSDLLDVEKLIEKGRTHDLEKLPQVLWAVTGIRVPNMGCFERLRRARNAVQHFCAPSKQDFRALSLEFIYTIIDPLILDQFGLYAIEYHEDHNVGYDYVVGQIISRQLKFSVPDDFHVTEIDIARECVDQSDESYKTWLRSELKRVDKESLYRESSSVD